MEPTTTNIQDNGQAQAQELLNAAMPLAHKLLTETGEFMPFAAAMTPAGDFVSVDVPEDQEEENPSEAMVADLQLVLRQAAGEGEYIATAVVYDTGILLGEDAQEPQDAVAVNLDHKSGFAMVVFVPYTIVDGKVQFAEMMAQEAESIIFAS
ncbi:hypothetical protein [Ferrimonas lipolytica]|uniref:Uncharacterized protein n=1 Tax=Ferrimonas lipolytica TaxID=2724191 RepID=A0A6H1UE93_9GAMM|nr:hypothetical protein [Ferrimonas lipolytica]QIZ76112.1 hypothetical protein HER31_03925 [Ferrimonas lipolytica]